MSKDALTLAVRPTGAAGGHPHRVAEALRAALGLQVQPLLTDDPRTALVDDRADAAIEAAAAIMSADHIELRLVATLQRHPVGERLLAFRGVLRPDAANPFGVRDGMRVGVTCARQAGPLLACRNVTIGLLDDAILDPLEALCRHRFDAVAVSGPLVADPELDRKGIQQVALRPEVMLPSPGHEAFCIMVRRDAPGWPPLSSLDHPPTRACVASELDLASLLGSDNATLGCLASETADGAVRLMASLSRLEDDLSGATVTTVAAVADDPHEAALVCAAAFAEIGIR